MAAIVTCATVWLGLAAQLRHVPPALRYTVDGSVGPAISLPPAITARLSGAGVLELSHVTAHPFMSGSSITLRPVLSGDARIVFFAFNLIPVRSVSIRVRNPAQVAVGGHAIGVIMDEPGLAIAAFSRVVSTEGHRSSPGQRAGLRVGDVMMAIDGDPLDSEEEFLGAIQAAGRAGRSVRLDVARQSARLRVVVQPQWCRDVQRYSLGIKLRGATAGVGTLSFYDPESMRYVALGHPVSDAGHGSIRGRIVRALVSGVQFGRRGQPGEKIGVFVEPGQRLGSVELNSPYGIVGELDHAMPNPVIPQTVLVAAISEVHLGPAQIHTVIDGQKVEVFSAEIVRLNHQDSPADRGIVIRIVDSGLLSRTGGIVQGMSGSPIIQDGRLVGAVTHVFVNDPTRGYGVYAEWMAEACGLFDVEIKPAA